jgi:hypothetical protein
MTRKALARRIAEVLFNEPATRRGAGAAPTRRGCADFGRVLCCSSVKDHSGYSPSSRRAPSQNSQQRCYTSLRLGAFAALRNPLSAIATEATPRVALNSGGLAREPLDNTVRGDGTLRHHDDRGVHSASCPSWHCALPRHPQLRGRKFSIQHPPAPRQLGRDLSGEQLPSVHKQAQPTNSPVRRAYWQRISPEPAATPELRSTLNRPPRR